MQRARSGRALLGLAAGVLALSGLTSLNSTATAAAPGFVPRSALINGDTVTTGVGITKGETPISLEQYAAERAGFTVTVVDGETWAGMSAAAFAKYQLLIVGDNECGDLSESVANWDTWAPVVMGATPANKIVGNRVLSGLDPSYHYTGGASPTEEGNPATAPAEHFVEAALTFAGAKPGATGLYFGPGCFDSDEAWTTLSNKLSSAGTGFTVVPDTHMDDVHLVRTPGASFPGLVPADLPDWENTAHTYFDTFPADYRPLAIATDAVDDDEGDVDVMAASEPEPRNRPASEKSEGRVAAASDNSTCGAKTLDGANVCGEAVAVFAGADPVVPTPPAATGTCRGEKATIVGTPGDDVLTGTAGRDVIVGLGGNDVIRGRGGNDLICAGDGNDKVRGGGGDDRIYGGAGDDRLYGGAGSDRVFGQQGNDTVRGGNGADRVSGGRGDDKLYGNRGDDVLRGGRGKDTGFGGPGIDTYVGVETHTVP
ncbi:calcium-binding protein [Sporichthya polymorpha]|uniref:calcium-binding protein n=1 Tax=Sporichthya polymorpha TaxID=35751 RepID=UPI000376E68D|nr:calcium-binding protein [Sporichthya polymorpha]